MNYRTASGIVAALVCAVPLALHGAQAPASTYPAKPVRVVVSVPAGGTPDVLARAVTPEMSALLGQQLVMDNRGGAAGRPESRLTCNRTAMCGEQLL